MPPYQVKRPKLKSEEDTEDYVQHKIDALKAIDAEVPKETREAPPQMMLEPKKPEDAKPEIMKKPVPADMEDSPTLSQEERIKRAVLRGRYKSGS